MATDLVDVQPHQRENRTSEFLCDPDRSRRVSATRLLTAFWDRSLLRSIPPFIATMRENLAAATNRFLASDVTINKLTSLIRERCRIPRSRAQDPSQSGV
uniref:Uncharacterized protein n=1 Tax=Grammatophora oceanica TaxID=210454 RepID=A0A7S1Y339_9STRA